jgi:hypothetical protein
MVMTTPNPQKDATASIDFSLQVMPGSFVHVPPHRLSKRSSPRLHRALHGLARGVKAVGQSLVLVGLGQLLMRI